MYAAGAGEHNLPDDGVSAPGLHHGWRGRGELARQQHQQQWWVRDTEHCTAWIQRTASWAAENIFILCTQQTFNLDRDSALLFVATQNRFCSFSPWLPSCSPNTAPDVITYYWRWLLSCAAEFSSSGAGGVSGTPPGSPVGSAAGLEAEPVMYCEPAFWCRYTSGISTLSV